jgi:hypothetical protein
MKRMTLVWLLLIGGTALAASANEETLTFYVQLIRGTDAETPPAPEARLVGPELDQRLHVFKWRNYWEVARRTILLKPGAKNRQRMTPQREVEIALTSPQEMTVSIYTGGQLTRRRKQAADTAFYIAGGDHDNAQCWFIVVRRDNPETASASVK